MGNWFTVEKIDADTFAISEYRHWEETHSYLILGTEKALLLDTGLGVANIKSVTDALTDLPVEVVTTHVHWDHIGGHRYFRTITVFAAEESWLSGGFPLSLDMVKRHLLCKPCDFPEDFQIETYQLYQGGASSILRDKDILDLGNRRLQVIHTPGHSPGHICLYEAERGCLFSGDLVYAGCLDAFYPTTDPQLFRQSVQKLKDIPICRILPAHHQLNIPVSLLGEISDGFEKLYQAGKLKQGCGFFSFAHFQIHI